MNKRTFAISDSITLTIGKDLGDGNIIQSTDVVNHEMAVSTVSAATHSPVPRVCINISPEIAVDAFNGDMRTEMVLSE